jgi:hypothetical protein
MSRVPLDLSGFISRSAFLSFFVSTEVPVLDHCRCPLPRLAATCDLGVHILASDFAASILPPPDRVSTTFSLENFCCMPSLAGQGISVACSHFYLPLAPVSSDIPLRFLFCRS